MKIAVFTDSRGYCPSLKDNWVSYLKQLCPEHDITHVIGDERIKAILQIPVLLKDAGEKYDLIVIQSGYSDFVVTWPFSILQRRLKDLDPSFSDHLEADKNSSPGRQMYRYRNYGSIERVIKHVRKYCDKVLFIGLHRSGERRAEFGGDSMMIANNEFASRVDSLLFPINLSWTKEHCYDAVHYIPETHRMVAGFVQRYIERLGKSIPDYL